MPELFIAVSLKSKHKFEPEFDERTAGVWRNHVEFIELSENEKSFNNGNVEHCALHHPQSVIFAIKALTSTILDSNPNIRRLTVGEMITAVNHWFAKKGISWRENVEAAKNNGPYRWSGVTEWCRQFALVDPERGLKVAAGILMQLKIVSLQELSRHFDTQPPTSHSAYFLGADPHSGDFGFINTLAAIISGRQLHEINKLPGLQPTDCIRVFTDAGWSGGESVRRLECMYQACEKKARAIGKENPLYLRFAYLTDDAEAKLKEKAAELHKLGRTDIPIQISCPNENKLAMANNFGGRTGLAFQNPTICNYIDASNPDAMREICKKIGLQIQKHRPLGTKDIASTIAFAHSLPRAMLPVLIYGGEEVCAHDGKTFTWKPLLTSKHVLEPAKDLQNYYCSPCPLAPKKP